MAHLDSLGDGTSAPVLSYNVRPPEMMNFHGAGRSMARAIPAKMAPEKNRNPTDVVARTLSVTRDTSCTAPSESVISPRRMIDARAALVRASVQPL